LIEPKALIKRGIFLPETFSKSRAGFHDSVSDFCDLQFGFNRMADAPELAGVL
jgi:hypothetical protein